MSFDEVIDKEIISYCVHGWYCDLVKWLTSKYNNKLNLFSIVYIGVQANHYGWHSLIQKVVYDL